MRSVVRPAFLALALAAGRAGSAHAQAPTMVGSWHGTSRCTDRTVAPACRDEVVIFDVLAHAGTRDTVMVSGDKVVNGTREFMYAFPFIRAADGTWTADVLGGRFQGRWTLVVRGDSMSGVLTDLPTGATVRRAELVRAGGPRPGPEGRGRGTP